MTICNPLNVSYRFQLEGSAEAPCREAADPSVVFYDDEYWLFASRSGGYWHSPDLQSWQFVHSSALPVEDYAPDAAVIDGYVYVTASRRGEDCPFFRTKNPASDQWEKVADCPEHQDPALFQDDDGRVYRYWGCSNHLPLYACEMDPESMLPVGETAALYESNRHVHGWERRGDDHSIEDRAPHVEGPWMSKHAGRYYLEYATPGTQYNVYCDAVLVADSPLGPFQLQGHNPHSYKPGGFIPGAGHGSTFRDHYGNWWHTSTMRISVRHKFERRIGLWPAGFDEDGVFFCNTVFGDYPMLLPEGRWDPWKDPFAGYMLLSYRARADASSALEGHPAELAFDESAQTYWAAESEGPIPTLTADLGEPCFVRAIQTNFAEHEATQYGRSGENLFFRYCIEGSTDGKSWTKLIDKSDSREDLPHDYVELEDETRAQYLKLSIMHVPGGKPAVSGFRIFGVGPGAVPSKPESVRVVRLTDDPRNALVEWSCRSDVIGANVRWGIAPDKLYSSYMVYDADSLHLRCLDREQEYYFGVESFNTAGVGPMSNVEGPC